MAEEVTKTTATDRAATRPYRFRRIVLSLAAALVLGWGGWFVWLVAVELWTERSLTRPLPASAVFPEERSTTDELIADLESAIGVVIDVDWERFNRTDRTYGYIGSRRAVMSGDMAIASIARALLPSEPMPKRSQDLEARTISTIDLESGGPRFTATLIWYIEGNRVVITTADNAPRFDASAWVRRQWHALEGWWAGGP